MCHKNKDIALQLSWESKARYSHARQLVRQGGHGNPTAVVAVPVICRLCSSGVAFLNHTAVFLFTGMRERKAHESLLSSGSGDGQAMGQNC